MLTKEKPHYRIAVLGYGAIGQVVVQHLNNTQNAAEVVAVLVRDVAKYDDAAAKLKDTGILLTNDADAFFNCSPDLVVEVAGQDAVIQYARRVLESGIDLMVSSIGAFTDDFLYNQMSLCASEHNRNLYLVGGALPGVGWMQGASNTEVYEVKITQIKPANSWLGTPAANLVNLEDITEPVCFFKGTARKAASIFRKSSNITAMLALTTVGMDKVQVILVADPRAKKMQTSVEFRGKAGELDINWQGVPSELNPSTSKDVALNVIKAINNICSFVKLGV